MTPREPAARPDGQPYSGAHVAVGTKHGKARQLAPPFRDVLGAHLVTPPDLDTDQFGTFSGEVARRMTAVEAARGKATFAMRVTGLPYGLASEASYGPLPAIGLPGHEELLVFVDDTRGIEVVGGSRPASPVAVATHRRLRFAARSTHARCARTASPGW